MVIGHGLVIETIRLRIAAKKKVRRMVNRNAVLISLGLC